MIVERWTCSEVGKMLNPNDPEFWRQPPVMDLNSGAVALSAGQTNKAWRGLVQTNGSSELSVPVVLKWIPNGPKLSIELACAIASSILQLPVPPGMLVLAHPDQLPGLSASAQRKQRLICFGSRLQWPDDTFARLYPDDAHLDYSVQHQGRRAGSSVG
jgi:hypothetical protein